MRTAHALAPMLVLLFGLPTAVMAQTAAPSTATAPAKKAVKPAATKAPEFKMVLEPRAIDLLKAMSARLAAAKTMSFTAVAGYEFPSKLGPPLVYTTRYDVAMQRPDKLRVLMPGDGPASEFYYDGKAMVAYAPVENLAAVANAPPTIDAAEDRLRHRCDLLSVHRSRLSDPYSALADGKLAFYIGPSGVVGGVKTEMVAWANDDVFLQIWLGVDDKLPRRVRAMFRADPLMLRHEMELSNWQLDGAIAAETFASAKAASAGRIAFAAPTIKLPPGMKPVALKKNPTPAAKPAAKSN